MMLQAIKYIVHTVFLFAIALFLTSCSKKQVELPGGGKLFETQSQVKVQVNNIIFPSDGNIMGFSLNKNYLYGWYNYKNKKGIVYFIINLHTGKVQEGNFYQIKKMLSVLEISMPNMSNELTYSQFYLKSERELQKHLQSKNLGIKKTFTGFLIYPLSLSCQQSRSGTANKQEKIIY